jgi:hypothetical protein
VKKFMFVTALATLVATASAASESWSVSQGTRGEISGIWNVIEKGSEITGLAKMSSPSGSVDYNFAGRVQNGVYSFTASNASDNRNCRFQGQKRPDGVIVGASICGAEQSPWIVRPVEH